MNGNNFRNESHLNYKNRGQLENVINARQRAVPNVNFPL